MKGRLRDYIYDGLPIIPKNEILATRYTACQILIHLIPLVSGSVTDSQYSRLLMGCTVAGI